MVHKVLNSISSTFNLLVVGGPTASGKTVLAVKLASLLHGEIVSADSRQVYCGLNIGTGKDLIEYRNGNSPVCYHLIDITNVTQLYTLYHFQRDFYRVFTEIMNRGCLPILCGGTGLYIEAILRNYEIPSVPEDPNLRHHLMEKEQEELERILFKLDEVRFNTTDRSSKKRIVRSIEIAMCIQKNELLSPPKRCFPEIRPLVLCTRWNREVLHKRIDERLNNRFCIGMVDEVRELMEQGITIDRLMMLGMEYKHITRYLCGQTDFASMKESLRHSIYQLAKRQETWFRGMEKRCGLTFCWIDDADFSTAVAVTTCLRK